MNRRLVGLVSGASALAASAAMLTVLYACSGDDNTTPPPVNKDSGTPDTYVAPVDGAPGVDAPSSTDSSTDAAKPPPACSSLPGTTVYIESGDTQEPLLKELGRQLRDDANITIVFLLTGSCTLTPNVYNGTAIPTNTQMLYIPSTAENPSWTTADAENTCVTSAATPPNLGVSALFTSSCGAQYATPPSGIGTFNGPVQAYTFIVPTAEFTTQTAIWAEEAYYALGDGANNPVTFGGASEWNVPAQFFLRPATKSTLVATSLNIGLTPAEATLAVGDGGSTDGRNLVPTSTGVVTDVAASTSMQALGILGDEVYDANRSKGISVLAFKAFGQNYAYYPDSTISSYDKQNIRDGHYTLWSPTVYIAPIDNSTGKPNNPAVSYITDLVLGNPNPTPPGGLVDGGTAINGLADIVKAGLTPYCAMQVQRSADGAPLAPYSPASPCTCYFLSKVTNAAPLPASCTTCTQASDCSDSGAIGCFNGYCEYPPTGPDADAGGANCDTVDDGGAGSIINACTTATAVDKTGVVLPSYDGGLAPLNP